MQEELYRNYFYTPVSRCVIGYGGRAGRQAGGRPHKFPHNNFSSVYRIFTKLGHTYSPVEGEEPYLFWGH